MNKTIIIQRFAPNVTVADPEDANLHRASWAAKALASFMTETRLGLVDGLETGIMDLICDMAHMCDRLDLDFEKLMRRAANHYDAETTPDDEEEGSFEHGRQFAFLEDKTHGLLASVVLDPYKNAIGYALELAYGDQSSYLDNGDPEVDYGNEWEETKAFKAEHFRKVAKLAELVGLNGERWNNMAQELEPEQTQEQGGHNERDSKAV
jgi:hypothetical protein